MKVITTESGPFAFGGIKVVLLKIGEVFEGKKADQLLKAGWAEEVTEQDIEDQEAAKQKEIDDKAAEEKRLAKEKEEADLLAEAQKLADGETTELKTTKKKTTGKKSK